MDKIDVLQRRKQIEHKLSKTNFQYLPIHKVPWY